MMFLKLYKLCYEIWLWQTNQVHANASPKKIALSEIFGKCHNYNLQKLANVENKKLPLQMFETVEVYADRFKERSTYFVPRKS